VVSFKITNCDLKRQKRTTSKVFTLGFHRHGAIMAATILNSEGAVAMSVYVVRAFVKMRRELLSDATLELRLEKVERRC
jgi:hypothetical protein